MSDDVQPATDAEIEDWVRLNAGPAAVAWPFALIARIRADAARLAVQGWRPIETAPRDGTFVILFDGFESGTRAPIYRVAHYMTARKCARRYGKDEYQEGWWADDDMGGPIEGATHWRPVLALPGDA